MYSGPPFRPWSDHTVLDTCHTAHPLPRLHVVHRTKEARPQAAQLFSSILFWKSTREFDLSIQALSLRRTLPVTARDPGWHITGWICSCTSLPGLINPIPCASLVVLDHMMFSDPHIFHPPSSIQPAELSSNLLCAYIFLRSYDYSIMSRSPCHSQVLDSWDFRQSAWDHFSPLCVRSMKCHGAKWPRDPRRSDAHDCCDDLSALFNIGLETPGERSLYS
jgi:hypothetical protein